MFSSGPNYTKLKTHLRLAINRLKLLEKKKTELAQKARKEIADYLATGKIERAKIRVEHIIREDYMVEAMEVVEMYCDLLLARYGLIQQMKTLDEGLSEAISSLLWVAPRMQTDISELKVISEQLSAKYGRQYADACREEAVSTISEKLKHKMSVQSPPKLLVEKYLIEIAKNYDIEYQPDPQVMEEDLRPVGVDALLIDIDPDKNNLGGPSVPPQPAGFVGFPQPPLPPPSNMKPFSYPNIPPSGGTSSGPSGGSAGGFISPPPPVPNSTPYGAPFSYNIPPSASSASFDAKTLNTATNSIKDDTDLPPPYSFSFPPDLPDQNKQSNEKPKPAPRSKMSPGEDTYPELPELPAVPTDSFPPAPSAPGPSDDIDFDDLTRRFEDLKKKK
ncbi:IST1 homolog [Schistocerca americana]|uniref:IST1 homolog n=1 Tax=Schistocerca americana TaxID=7009 RepID=UPI001F4F438B|nr:IST1 homolog [Schistocerca americana]